MWWPVHMCSSEEKHTEPQEQIEKEAEKVL